MTKKLVELRLHEFIFVLCGLLMLPTQAGAAAPAWLQKLADAPVPAEASATTPAWVLLDETTMEVNDRGEATETHRFAVRLRINAGSSYASVWLSYNGKSDRVISTEAWLVRQGKAVREKSGSDWVDLAAASEGAVIDENRARWIDFKQYAVGGDVFGYETQVRCPLQTAQLLYNWGGTIPVQEKSLRLILPAGFSVNAFSDGAQSLVATAAPEHGQWSWVLRNSVYKPDEPWLAPAAQFDARIFVQIIPSAAAQAKFTPPRFVSWHDVANWWLALNTNQCDTSPELVARVHALTAGLSEPLAKIRALGRYVQKLRYVSINENLNAGGGFQAHKASVVFAHGYGDCKDKANLLRAMLRECGMTSYLVSALSAKDIGVLESRPSLNQFNHAILAIAVDDTVQLPTVVFTTKWGRVLFFDPTDEHTILGDLPRLLQGTRVQLEAEGSDALITLPVLPAQDDFSLQRKVCLKLTQNGDLGVEGSVVAQGQVGADLRNQVERATMPQELEKLISQELSDGFRGATVQEKKTEDDPVSGRCGLTFSCVKKQHAQFLPDNITVVKLDVLSRHRIPSFPEKVRHGPIELPTLVINDEVLFELPSDQTAEEMPASTKLESPYGKYELTCAVEQNTVVLHRTITFNKVEVPVSDYEKLKKYLSDIARADRSSVLLKRRS